LHSASTDSLTYYQVDTNRAGEAFDRVGILPGFQGVAVHDALPSYLKRDVQHALCNAHLLRELTALEEQTKQRKPPFEAILYPQKMQELAKKWGLDQDRGMSKTGRRTLWAEVELGEAELGDERRTQRAVEIVAARAKRPEASLPGSLGDSSEVKAGYRFYENEEVEASAILSAHRTQAIDGP